MTPRLPTTDLYFAHACGDWIHRWWRPAPIQALGNNCFVAGDTLLLIRKDEDALMRRALNWPGRLIYLIDDDIAGAAECLDLPADYRQRLMDFDKRFHSRLLERADLLLVSSDTLAALFKQNPLITAEIRRIDPYWPHDFADQRHFAGLQEGAPLQIVHLGSGSHAGAFTALVPALLEILEGPANVQFTYFGLQPPPGLPRRHPRIKRLKPMRWPAYRRWLERQRFHLALYPLELTRFDDARSANKVIEHAIIGAVGVYPKHWPLAQLTGGGCLTAPSHPADWGQTLRDAIEKPSKLAECSEQSTRFAADLNDGAAQRILWSELLEIRFV